MNFNNRMKIRNFSQKHEKRKKHILRFMIIGIILLGIIYQQVATYYCASSLGRVGRLVKVGDANMHLYESGTGNKLPLVFTTDIGVNVPYVETYSLHSKLAHSHPVSVYDKPGYGWSEMTSAPRDIDTICKEIHTLLHSSEIPDDEDTYIEPFIFVGYGMSSLEILRYAQLYPNDVAGIVLIEGASPQFCIDFNNIMIMESFLTNGLRNIGVLRLFSNTNMVSNTLGIHKDYAPELQALSKGLALEKTWNRNVLAERLKIQDNGQTVLDGGDLGDIPLRIITSQANVYSSWMRTQKSMLTLSSDSEQTYIKGSVDYIQEDDVSTILEVIEELNSHIEELREES